MKSFNAQILSAKPPLNPPNRMSTSPETTSHQRIDIELGERSYPIYIGPDLLQSRSIWDAHLPSRQVLIVTNTTVAPLYMESLAQTLAPRRVTSAILPDGEQYKTLHTFSQIIDSLVENRLNRDAAIVALGGGVIGDMAGFAAACYQRGIEYVQVPTTLLAQVDSSVGGKTAINHPKAKNMVGAFYQPKLVLADTATLRTLPDREYRAGLAEVVKYGFIYDIRFLEWLERNVEALNARDESALIYAIRRSCEIKAEVVSIDERENGLRAILNLGHTFGHAIETAEGYGSWLHGEAVAAGMVMALELSTRLNWIESSDHDRGVALIKRMQLPVVPPRIGVQRAFSLMGMDKKVVGGQVRLILLRKLGRAEVVADYPVSALEATLKQFFD
jgi:3-dehydroquinate synthase